MKLNETCAHLLRQFNLSPLCRRHHGKDEARVVWRAPVIPRFLYRSIDAAIRG